MKRRIKIVALVLTTFLSTLGYAGSKNAVEMKVMGVNTFALILNDVTNAVQVQLLDNNGYLLHKEDIQNLEKYAKLYDVSALPDGSYHIKLDYKIKTAIFPLEIRYGQVLLKTDETIEIFKPSVFQKCSLLTVSLFSAQKEPLNVTIYDSNNQLIHQDKLFGEMYLGRRYDLSAFGRGKYTVTLTSGGRSYNHYIMI